MTASPEAYLARELELSFQILGLVTDYDSWCSGQEHHHQQDVSSNVPDIMNILKSSFGHETLSNVLGSIIEDLHSYSNPWKGKVLRQALVRSDNLESSKSDSYKFFQNYVFT